MSVLGGLAVGNFLDNLYKDIGTVKENGVVSFLRSKPWGDYDPLQKEFWTKEGQMSYIKTAAKNFLDPGDLFGLFGDDEKKEKNPKIAGKTQEEWVESLGMDEGEFETNLSNLIRTISTGAAESRATASDISAREDLPAATQLATERGINLRQTEAAQEGELRLTQIREDMNRQAEQIALQMFAQKEISDENYARAMEAQTTQSMGNLLNLLGQYLGENYFGGGDVSSPTSDVSTTGYTDYDAYGDYSNYV